MQVYKKFFSERKGKRRFMENMSYDELLKKEEILRNIIYAEDARSQKKKRKRGIGMLLFFSIISFILFLKLEPQENVLIIGLCSLFAGGCLMYFFMLIYAFIMQDATITMPEDRYLKALMAEYEKLPAEIQRPIILK